MRIPILCSYIYEYIQHPYQRTHSRTKSRPQMSSTFGFALLLAHSELCANPRVEVIRICDDLSTQGRTHRYNIIDWHSCVIWLFDTSAVHNTRSMADQSNRHLSTVQPGHKSSVPTPSVAVHRSPPLVSPSSPQEHSCEICGAAGLSDDVMREHTRSCHVEGCAQCPFCGLSGVEPAELLLHVNQAHLDYLTPENELMSFIDDQTPRCVYYIEMHKQVLNEIINCLIN